jgi:hypothetical protein
MMRRGFFVAWLALALAPVACGGGEQEGGTPIRGGKEVTPRSTNLRGLDVTITANKEVYGVGEPIAFTLRVKNPTDVPILLRFASGQRYDFVIQSAAGEERWRWSAGRTFTQALGEQTVPQAWEMDYNERFVGPLPAGRYRIRGFVTAVGDTLEAWTEVVVGQ